jgi:hypothetical protein
VFGDDDQASRAIRLLLAELSLQRFWGDEGPTKELLLRYDHDLPLPPAKRALLLAAFSLWTPLAPSIAFGDVVRALDLSTCEALCSLLIAYKTGPQAVEAWIGAATARHGEMAPPAPDEADPPTSIIDGWPTLDGLSARYVRRVLEHTHGNRTRAAAMLGVDRRTVGRLLGGAPRRRPVSGST